MIPENGKTRQPDEIRRRLRGGSSSWRDGSPHSVIRDRVDCGPRTTCYNRFVRWRRAGVWDQIIMRWPPVMIRRCR
jgi:transposase